MRRYLYLFIFIVLISCNGGLEPLKLSYISGKIIYTKGKNNWPPQDSLKDLRIFFFKEYPDTANILNDIITGNLVFSDSTLPYNVSETKFERLISNTPIEYKYIAVGQNYGTLFEWRVVGLYSDDNKTPKTLRIGKDSSVFNILINVDFTNLPPQPF